LGLTTCREDQDRRAPIEEITNKNNQIWVGLFLDWAGTKAIRMLNHGLVLFQYHIYFSISVAFGIILFSFFFYSERLSIAIILFHRPW
jgi:hypothetical protein